MLVFPLAFLGCTTDEDEPEKVEATEGTARGQEEDEGGQPETFKVGDMVALGDYEVTVHGVQDPLPPQNQLVTVPPGDRYVGVDVEVTNTTDESKPFSGLLAFELQDAENRTYDPTFSGHQPAMPDGELAPNSGKRGLAVFQVPEVMSALRLNFDSSVFGTGTATVNLS